MIPTFYRQAFSAFCNHTAGKLFSGITGWLCRKIIRISVDNHSFPD